MDCRKRSSRLRRLVVESLEARDLFASDLAISAKTLNPFVDGEVLVQFVAQTTAWQRDLIRNEISGAISEIIQTPLMQQSGVGKLERIKLPQGMGIPAALEKLKGNPWVAFAEPNYIVSPTALSNDPMYANGSLWGMYSDDIGGAIGPSGTTNAFGSQAEKAWARGITGSSRVIVGVIDQGIQVTHPDLIDNIWVNPFENPNDGIDNDGNGYIDDKYGWDFLNNDNSVFDGADPHGTHVAGTIGATGNNGLGVAGVNWDVSIIAAKFIGPNSGTVADAVEALDYLTDLKIRHGINLVATNNSWGGSEYSQALQDAILRSAKQDILFVAAAGNSSKNNDTASFYPANYNTLVATSAESAASYDAVISVAAIKSNGSLASFSSYGQYSVDIAAPGEGILSTLPNNYGFYSGTSMATPHVTGAIALLASQRSEFTSAASLKNTILQSAKPSSLLNSRVHTGGFLDINQSLLPRDAIQLNSPFYLLSQSPTVTVSHGTANQDPNLVESITVEISTPSQSQSKSILLQETSKNSGVFQGGFLFSSTPTQDPTSVFATVKDQVAVQYAPLNLTSFATLTDTQETLVQGTPFSDSIVATYTGDGTKPRWSVSVNGSILFNNQVPENSNLLIGGLDGNDTLIVQGTSLSDLIEIDGQFIKVNGWGILASSMESVVIRSLDGNDSVLYRKGTATIDGGAGTDRIESVVLDNSWNINGPGSGSLNSIVNFSNIESIQGSSGPDQFKFGSSGSLLGQIHGGLSSDTLDFSAKTTGVTINLATAMSTFTGGFVAIENFVGSSSNADALVSPNAANVWQVVAADSGVLNNQYFFSGVENLTGGTLVDSFVIADSGSLTGTINGGTGVDVLNLTAKFTALDFRLATAPSIPGVLGAYVGLEQVQSNSVGGSKVTGSNAATAWSISNTGQIVVGGVTYFGVDSIVAGTAADTLTGPALAANWTVSGTNIGTLVSSVSTINFSGVENLTGGTLVDSFVIAGSGSLTGTINGGTGVDVLNLTAKSTALDYRLATAPSIPGVLGGYVGLEQVQSNSVGGSKVTGSNAATAWSISNTGQIVVGGVTYFGVDSIVAGTAADTLTGPALAANWTVSGTNIGTLVSSVSTINFSGVENLTGGTLVDSFVIAGSGSLTGTINGGTGVDVLNLTAKSTALDYRLATAPSIPGVLGGYVGLEQVQSNSVGGSKVTGSNAATAWSISNTGQIVVGGVTYFGVDSIVAGTAADTLTGPALAANWTVSGTNIGTLVSSVSTINFSGVENLTGGTLVDSFVIAGSGSLTGTINGGTGVDVLNLTAKSTALDYRLATAPSIPGVLGGYVGLEQVQSNSVGGSKVTGSNAATAWSISNTGQIVVGGVTYFGVDSIVAGTAADTLTGPALAANWTVSGTNVGTLVSSVSTISFSGVENLTGNIFEDSIELFPEGRVTGNINGGSGVGLNSLSYSRWSRGVLVDLSISTAGNAQSITGITSLFQLIIGGAGNDFLKGASNSGTILVGLAGNDTLIGGMQRDLLFGGAGADILNGAGGDDLLISGVVAYETDRTSFYLIYGEWQSSRTFAQRTANLAGNGTGVRANGNIFLNSNVADSVADTVFADSDSDVLTGGLNQDWFFSNLDEISDFVGTGTAPDRRDG
jgi:subtilisin family serine protease